MTGYIDKVFGPGGYLAARFSGYETRPGQIQLAEKVHEAIHSGRHLLAEGPTGTGKSIGYAVPAIHASREGKKIVIATANIALQEQLVNKDLPLLQDVLPGLFSFALMKGRNNYLCLSTFYENQQQGTFSSFFDGETIVAQKELVKWANKTDTGDVSELDFEPPSQLWRLFSSTADDCRGSKCEYKDNCFANTARARARDADIVVCNYHLLFSHLKVREQSGLDLILPPFDVAICDEGHKAADIARDFFGFRITGGSVRWATRMLEKIDEPELMHRVHILTDDFFSDLAMYRDSEQYKIRLRKKGVVPWTPLCQALRDTADAYQKQESTGDHKLDADLDKANSRCGVLVKNITEAMTLEDGESVYYLEQMGNKTALRSKLIKVGHKLRTNLFDQTDSVIVTSATLATGKSFEFVAQEIGANDIERTGEIVADTPFDFVKQALIVAPEGLPNPNDPAFPEQVPRLVEEIINYAEGRTLGLFTSYKNLNATYDYVSGRVNYNVMRQGDQPRMKLVAEFRTDINSVLLGTESFWVGVDVPGESLSCLVIDRLPFQAPGDPVMDAISERDDRWFWNYSLPRAVIAFKQGFGRLVRSMDDRGVVVILDNRLIEKSYGKIFITSLPNTTKTRKLENVRRFLDKEVLIDG